MTILKEFVHSVKEQERLRAVVRFETVPGEQSQVHWAQAGRSAVVRDADDGWLRVFLRDELVAEHEKARGKHQVIINREHLAGLWERVMGRERKAGMLERAAPVQSPRLVLFGREMPLVSVESRELSYYEEVAG